MRTKIYIFITALLIGIALGYAWRMAQVEPSLDKDISYIYSQNQRLTRDLVAMDTRISLLEDQVLGIQRKLKIRR